MTYIVYQYPHLSAVFKTVAEARKFAALHPGAKLVKCLDL